MTDSSDTPAKTRPPTMHRVVVLELDDVVPRIRADRPNLLVAATSHTADSLMKALMTGKGRQAWARGRVRGVRGDLAPEGLWEWEEAKVKRDQSIRTLRSDGYTVNRITTAYRTYVINLHDPSRTEVGAGYVYVGQTSKPLEKRLEEHLTDARSAKGTRLASAVVTRFGVDINWYLTPQRIYVTQATSKRAERRLAERLRQQGYVVKGGH